MGKHTCFSPSQLHISHVYFLSLSLSSQLHISQTFHLYLPPVLCFFPSPTSNSIFTQTLIHTIPHTLTISHFSPIPTLYFSLLSTLTHSSSQPTMSGQPKTTGQACRMPQVRWAEGRVGPLTLSICHGPGSGDVLGGSMGDVRAGVIRYKTIVYRTCSEAGTTWVSEQDKRNVYNWQYIESTLTLDRYPFFPHPYPYGTSWP